MIFLLAGSATFSNFAYAYEKENHYWLKMALALNCGFTIDEARLISTGDFVIDEDWSTQPVLPGGGQGSVKWKWHALPTENPDVDKNTYSDGNQQIKKRQKDLYDRAMKEKDINMKLFKFGEYLHYEEDKWSHWGYTTAIGHAGPNLAPGTTSPDATHANPEFYHYMVFDSMVNLGKLAKSLGKDTECLTDLLPIDTYHTTPEFGKDFPWFSPNELKRYDKTKTFQKQVNEKLADWGKSKLIDDAMTASKNDGATGVTNTFINYVSEKTGISKSDIREKYDYNDDDLDIDDDGNTKKIPDHLTKNISTKVKQKQSTKIVPDKAKTNAIKPNTVTPQTKTEKPTTKPTAKPTTKPTTTPKPTTNTITPTTPSNTKPSMTIPKSMTAEATGASGASVSFNVSAQDKEDGAITPTCSPSSGSTFPIGSSTVSCSAKDSTGNSVSGSFTITVRDTTPPVIDPIQPSEGARDDTGVVVFFTVTAHDAVDGPITPNCNYSSGTKFPIGTTVLTCTADDSRGNHGSRSLQITVTIKESTAP